MMRNKNGRLGFFGVMGKTNGSLGCKDCKMCRNGWPNKDRKHTRRRGIGKLECRQTSCAYLKALSSSSP